jgi:hypothetical protein
MNVNALDSDFEHGGHGVHGGKGKGVGDGFEGCGKILLAVVAIRKHGGLHAVRCVRSTFFISLLGRVNTNPTEGEQHESAEERIELVITSEDAAKAF